jgi:hypothetical protein
VSYLPLSHIGAQIFEMWVAILVAGTLYFGPPETGKMTELPRPPGTVSAAEGLRGGGGLRPEPEFLSWAPCECSVLLSCTLRNG